MTAEIITNFSKFSILYMFALYTFDCFSALVPNASERKRNRLYHTQNILMYLILFNANFVLFVNTSDDRYLIMACIEILFLALMLVIYKRVYVNISMCLLNNACMLMAISFITISRLDLDRGFRQFGLAFLALAISSFVPAIISKNQSLREYKWLMAGIGLLALVAVLLLAESEYGAKLSIGFGPISIQPSEFVKLIFVMFVASMLYENTKFSNIMVTSIVAVGFVLLLVICKDLGSAVIFVLTYVFMLFVATGGWYYLILGFGACTGACLVAYKMFSHVQTRVYAWRDPLADVQNKGYQLSQSLFAISSGDWMGAGLMKGMPEKIPVVTKDFIFSAIAEEFGNFFAICLILVYISTFLMIFSIALKVNDRFYKLIVVGFGCVYVVQLFLSLGGVIKFIPATGVTLPFVSYGGSSLMMMMIMQAIVQGIYTIEVDEDEEKPKRRKNTSRVSVRNDARRGRI